MAIMATVTQTGIELWPLSVEQYEERVRAGVLGPDDKVELLRGVLAAVSSEGVPHAWLIQQLTGMFVRGVDPERFGVRIGSPVRLDATISEPQPDIAIVAARSYAARHPETAQLLVEVSHSSLRKDTTVKLGIYAEEGVPEYWVVDVGRLVVRVHRRPVDGRYQDVFERAAGSLAPLADGIATIDLDELFAELR
jgi:Uma2 family endonuclease